MYEEINQNRRRFLSTAAMTMAATQLGLIGFARASNRQFEIEFTDAGVEAFSFTFG
jgi:hypothetical protein